MQYCAIELCVSEVDHQLPDLSNLNVFTVSYCRDFPDVAAREIKRLYQEQKFARETTRRQSNLLTSVVNTLRGEPPPLTVWSHYDTPMLAQALVHHVKWLRGTLTDARTYVRGHPDCPPSLLERVDAVLSRGHSEANDPEFTHPDPDLNNLLNLTVALHSGHANMDVGVAWQRAIEALERRLQLPVKVAGDPIPPASNERMRPGFEKYILHRGTGIAYLQRNHPSVDADHDYEDVFIQEAWEAWQAALSEEPSAVATLTSTQQLREALRDVCLWLKSALECKQWVWDLDQRLAAMGCLEAAAEVLLTAPADKSAVQVTDLETHAHEGLAFRADRRSSQPATTVELQQRPDMSDNRSSKQLIMADGTPLYDYLKNAVSDTESTDEWTRGYEECKRRLFTILGPQLLQYAITMQRARGKTPAQELSEWAAVHTEPTGEASDDSGPSP